MIIVPTSSVKGKNGEVFTHVNSMPDDKNIEIVTGYIEKNTKEKERAQEREKEREKEKEKNGENKKSGKWKLIPLGLLLIVGVISLKGCENEQKTLKTKSYGIEWVYNKTGNPSEQAHGMQQRKGQEELFNGVNGYSIYNSDKAYIDEHEASKDAVKYEEYQKDVEEKAKQLGGNGQNVDDRQLLEAMEKDLEEMNKTYKKIEPKAQEYADGYIDALRVNPDGNTLQEEEVIRIAENEFLKDSDLAEENYETLKDITNKEGKLIIEDVEIESDGDIRISGKEIVKVVEQEKTTGIKAAFRNIKDFITNIKNNIKGSFQENDDNQR